MNPFWHALSRRIFRAERSPAIEEDASGSKDGRDGSPRILSTNVLRRSIYTKILCGAVVKFGEDFEILRVEPCASTSNRAHRGLADSGFALSLTHNSHRSTENDPSQASTVASNADLDESRDTAGLTWVHSPTSPQQQPCVVCMCEAENPCQIYCGHSYCKDCLVNQCLLTSPPFKCPGDLGRCTNKLKVNDVQAVLGRDQLEDVFNRALSAYVRSYSDELQCCPTPDCNGIFRVSTEEKVQSCPVCAAAICRACSSFSHPDLTCAQYRDSISGWTVAFTKWKAENGVRNCPACRTSIEKVEGCNHVQCGACGRHFCWSCEYAPAFRSEAEVYAHMRADHASWGADHLINPEQGQFNADGW